MAAAIVALDSRKASTPQKRPDPQKRRVGGCAVWRALAEETLDPTRFRNFTKMRREVEHLEREQDTLARLEQKRVWKNIHQDMKKMYEQRW